MKVSSGRRGVRRLHQKKEAHGNIPLYITLGTSLDRGIFDEFHPAEEFVTPVWWGTERGVRSFVVRTAPTPIVLSSK